MNSKVTFIALAAAAATLSACGGSGTTVNTAPTYAELVARADTAAAGIIDLQTGQLDPAVTERTTLPASGSADYTGYIGGDTQGGLLIGELSMTATFTGGDGGTVTGSATNFQHETNGAYTGTLALTNGTILAGGTASDPDTLQADLTGTLTNNGTPQVVDVLLDGSFVGGTGTDVPTSVAGSGIGTIGADNFDPSFIATQ